jgi:arylsulfatase A-like enzyme
MPASSNVMQLLAIVLMLIGLTSCGGGSDSTSTPTSPPSVEPTNSLPTGSVSITGETELGSVLLAVDTLEDANGLGEYSYQWFRNNEAISNATNRSYQIVDADLGLMLSATISYQDNDGFFESVSSEPLSIPSLDAASSPPNIVFIITDDQGLDASSQYGFTSDLPDTPSLDALADQGVIFENTWVTPACTTTRAAIMTGMHGVNSGVTTVPAVLDTDLNTIAKYLKSPLLEEPYATGAFGKWHLAGGRNAEPTHPNLSGFDHFAGSLGNIDDYNQWELTVNGVQSDTNVYHTTAVVDYAIEWIEQQTSPWFAWVAFQAPHTPLHLPPSHLHNRSALTGSSDDIANNPRAYYLASIDAMDAEVGRLIESLDEEVRNNTVFVFIGDNGTPRNVVDTNVFARARSKSTLYEGGIRVPMFISGKGIVRSGERESALVNATDFYTTLGQIAGLETNYVFDSTSFYTLLSDSTTTSVRSENYSEFESEEVTGWTVRDESLKLIQFSNGTQELYDVSVSFYEDTDLSADSEYANNISRLYSTGLSIRGETTPVQSPIDITGQVFTRRSANCEDYVESYTSNVLDVNRSQVFSGALTISVSNGKCVFQTNAIPNHDFNDGEQAFPNSVSAQDDRYEMTSSPSFANSATALSLRTDNAILLNGVKVDLLAAGCFGIGNGKIGCGDIEQPWRYDPMFRDNGFNVDTHNAHSQSDGTYHYHGTPNAFYHEHNTGSPSPVIGFAADGFPIFGPYFDDNGTVRKALSSFKLRSGQRPNGDGEPGGTYDGAFRDDYEYVSGSGDLDECNGMTVDGVYGYYITDNFPYILSCFKGVTDPSFDK